MRSQREFDRLRVPSIPDELLSLQSGSEYACAKMLEKYCGWKALDGATTQIKVGRTIFDFRIHNTFVEYHPISLKREFITDGMRAISSAIHGLSKPRKVEILKAVAEELEAQYAKRRGQVLSAHPVYGEMPLICVHTPEEFIRKIICRFAVTRCGDVESLRQEFNKLRKEFIALRQKDTGDDH
jgi:hypothetical protein